MMGTVAYMSPEQVRARELDLRTDLFSFEAKKYEMATGQLPFNGSSAGEICGAILHQNPLPPSQLSPQLPPQMENKIEEAPGERSLPSLPECSRNVRRSGALETRLKIRNFSGTCRSLAVGPPVSSRPSELCRLHCGLRSYRWNGALLSSPSDKSVKRKRHHRSCRFR